MAEGVIGGGAGSPPIFNGNFDGLNDRQKEAVMAPPGPLVVLAGAGSGKTRVLTYRFAYLSGILGIPAGRILAITFTNKAAEEMKQRLGAMLPGADLRWVRTFHSASLMMLRSLWKHREKIAGILSDGGVPYAELLASQNGILVADRDDAITIVQDILATSGFPKKNLRKKARDVVERMSLLKRSGIYNPGEFADEVRYMGIPAAGELFVKYHQMLYGSGRVDFDDLITFVRMILDSDMGDILRDRFDAVLVDEFQDVSRMQFEMAVELSLGRGEPNITVVGDIQQSIYSWRGASPRYVDEFLKVFPNAKVVKLDINYRSARRIVDVINHLSDNMGIAHKFPVKAATDEPGHVEVVSHNDGWEEARWVAQKIQMLSAMHGLEYEDFAVLYRINAQSRLFESVFAAEGIPYTVVGSTSFYERMEIKDMIAYLTLVLKPLDAVALRRVINVPRRGIGAKSLATILDALPKVSTFRQLAELPISQQAKRGVLSLAGMLERWHEMYRSGATLKEILEQIIDDIDYLGYLESIGEPERRENIGELFNILAEADSRGQTLDEFLSEIVLRTDADKERRGVSLMTMHAAKGLEFDTVFVVGVEDGYVPLRKGNAAYGELSVEEEEEEMRLFYVALSRAKRRLFVSYATTRMLWGDEYYREPSPFLEYVKAAIEGFDSGGGPQPEPETYSDGDYRWISVSDPDMLVSGDVVKHPKYGVGRVKIVRGKIVTIDFEGGTRTIYFKPGILYVREG